MTITVTTDEGVIDNSKTNKITATGTYGSSQTVTGDATTSAGNGSDKAQKTYTISLTMPAGDLTKIEVVMADQP